ncbi:50S ribosomal protein L10 [Candidatus Micrarchaeota archaeon]|nr:50S ribosomal protein L10 [Candidatus Micrarchaeota archaeon]MBU1166766.1 50S ribosomal protein L10 [Candidatus Micrarchaeota archaeon]MBU1887236.1 50S ribosomal protein L10 [Candidatus Micrarchaeota archaeon]
MVYIVDTNKKAVKKKIEQVTSTIKDIENYKTVALLRLRKLPDALLQSLRKKIRSDGGKLLVLKKPVISRVLLSNKKLAEKVSECDSPVALILTNTSPYELNQFFKQHKKKRAAKIGDVANADIVVPEGETDLAPGPALSELKAGGLNVQIKGGKIVVARESTVAKKGEAITEPKVKALKTLGVMPFEIAASMIFGFDGEYIYSSELLDMGDTIDSDLTASISQAMNISINAGYPCEQNINMLLGKAAMQSLNLALNADIYSSSSIEQLLSSALRQGLALESIAPKGQTEEEKKE